MGVFPPPLLYAHEGELKDFLFVLFFGWMAPIGHKHFWIKLIHGMGGGGQAPIPSPPEYACAYFLHAP